MNRNLRGISALAALGCGLLVQSAWAGPHYPGGFWRSMGLFWSDGYHAHAPRALPAAPVYYLGPPAPQLPAAGPMEFVPIPLPPVPPTPSPVPPQVEAESPSDAPPLDLNPSADELRRLPPITAAPIRRLPPVR